MFDRIIAFLKEVKIEIKKISWPSRQQTVKHTLIVIGVSMVTAVFLGGWDYIFAVLLNFFIL